MSVIVPDEILATTGLSDGEMKQEIAIMLFAQEKLTLAQASRFAGVDRMSFQHLLASRQIPVHYDVSDFEKDLENLREIGRV
jgi:predicted HTH domain antitoxin